MSNISPLFAVEAEELLKSGRAQEAIDLCKQGIEAFPNYTIAYGILARAHSAIGDTAVAESVLENAAQHFPRSKTIRKIVDLSHSGDINQILHEFEETLEKQTKSKKQSNKKKSQTIKQTESVSEAKESDLINELIEDIEYERFVQKNYQEKVYTQAEISDLKLIFTSDKIDAYVLPFKANFVSKNKREAHFSHDNFMFPPLFFDIKFNPEKITSPVLNFNDETDDIEKDMFFDDAIATFNTSLSMNNESDKLEAKQELLNEEIIETNILEVEVEESTSLENIQLDEEYLTTENETAEVLVEANLSKSTFDDLVSNLESEVIALPENDTAISDEATQSLLQELSELEFIEELEGNSNLIEVNSDILTDEEKSDIEDEIMELVGDLDESLKELEKLDIFEQIESPILEESAVITDKYSEDVDIMAMIEELENPQTQSQNNEAISQFEPNQDDILEQELLSDFEIDTDEDQEENEDLVGDIFGKIITDNTPRNLSIEQIGNQLNNFGAEEIEEVEEENYSDFASETIAEIFAEQGAYTNAIKMYTKLIDQEPEKAEYFLSRIEEIKILKNQ